MKSVERRLALPPPAKETFFLWGPRQTGKSTLLRQRYPDALWVDLLKPEVYRRYVERPELLREITSGLAKPFVVIDEVQRVPQVLDEVHWQHENRGVRFALCGSSARKVRRGHANLLGGRARSYELHGLSAIELGTDFELKRVLNAGYLPSICLGDDDPRPLLNAYVGDYLREEIAAEGLVRRLPVFSEFLNLAALSDTEVLSYVTIARDTGVASQTIRNYFDLLVDTLVGRYLPAYRRRPKRRVVAQPKFFFADVGVVGFLAKRGTVEPGSELFGKAFENWVFHELCAYNAYAARFAEFYYWRLTSGAEVDFLVNHIDCAIEAKAVRVVRDHHLRGLRELAHEQPKTKQRVLVSLDSETRRSEDGILMLPYRNFVQALWSGTFF